MHTSFRAKWACAHIISECLQMRDEILTESNLFAMHSSFEKDDIDYKCVCWPSGDWKPSKLFEVITTDYVNVWLKQTSGEVFLLDD